MSPVLIKGCEESINGPDYRSRCKVQQCKRIKFKYDIPGGEQQVSGKRLSE